LNSQSYVIDTIAPVVTIIATTLIDNEIITDTRVTVIDDVAVDVLDVYFSGASSV
jgi:hypothetical protein